jgi:CDP-6-deoxy-D-xylo-4-hexulose-3-dehydrase
MLAHTLGNPFNLDVIKEVCKKNNLWFIEDCCDALGSTYQGQMVGTFGDISTLSFYPAHHITMGEGGAVFTNNAELKLIAESFRDWGRDCYCVGPANLLACGSCGNRFDKWIPDVDVTLDHKYVFSNIGYNLKPLDLQGGMGLAQLKKVDDFNAKRKHNKIAIQSILDKNIAGLSFPISYLEADVSWFGVPVICKNKDIKEKLVALLENNGIQTRNYFAGNILLHPAYKHLEDANNYQNANKVLESVFFLGTSPTITQLNIDYIEKILSGKSL